MENEIDKTLIETIEQIKKDILSTRNRILENANNELLNLYFRIEKVLWRIRDRFNSGATVSGTFAMDS